MFANSQKDLPCFSHGTDLAIEELRMRLCPNASNEKL